MTEAAVRNSRELAEQPGPKQRMQAVASIAAAHAADVDAAGRFPREVKAALCEHGLLAVMIPAELGGEGLALREIVALCACLAAACGSSGLIYAMHQIKLASAVRHPGSGAWHRAFLARVARENLLIGSVTSEVGVGGDIRRSIAALRHEAGAVRLRKHGSAISYGLEADVLMVTARTSEEAPESRQIMLTVLRGQYALEQTSAWDCLGMRGTCSHAFVVEAEAAPEQVFEPPFADILAATMLPVSHILWSSVWFGIASDAVARTRAVIRARRRAGGGSGASGLSDLVARMLMLKSRLVAALDAYEPFWHAPAAALPIALAADLALLKTSLSEGCLAVAQQAMQMAGIAGYRNDTPTSLGRHLRDLQSAPLMISNRRHAEQVEASLLLGRLPFELG